MEGQEESRQTNGSYAEPDKSWFLPNDQISYRPEERGLCSVCSQYDWRWHLTPGQDLTPPGGYYRCQRDYEQRSLITGEKFHHDMDKTLGIPATRAPYPGHYEVSSSGWTCIPLLPFSTMRRTQEYCALCDLTVRAVSSFLHGKELKQLEESSEPMKLSCAGRARPVWGAALVFYPIGYTTNEILGLRFNLLSEVTQPPPSHGRVSTFQPSGYESATTILDYMPTKPFRIRIRAYSIQGTFTYCQRRPKVESHRCKRRSSYQRPIRLQVIIPVP